MADYIKGDKFESFISQAHHQRFACCFIDIHPTLDPRWLPGLNWLRNRCRTRVTGPLRIWGYQWMVRELVCGLLREYLPLLRHQHTFDDDLGHALACALPVGWEGWSAARLHGWLTTFATQIAWPQMIDDRRWTMDDGRWTMAEPVEAIVHHLSSIRP